GSEIQWPNAAAPGTQHRSSLPQTRRETPATFPDMGDKLPEMTDRQPLPVESTVLRQLPHYYLLCSNGTRLAGHHRDSLIFFIPMQLRERPQPEWSFSVLTASRSEVRPFTTGSWTLADIPGQIPKCAHQIDHFLIDSDVRNQAQRRIEGLR